MRLKLILVITILLIVTLACGGSQTSTRDEPRRGWLCDYDKTGQVRLWNSASMEATVKDIVGVSRGGCVDVSMYEFESVNGILFYRISVGSQSGWVDVDYYYNSKPAWSTNQDLSFITLFKNNDFPVYKSYWIHQKHHDLFKTHELIVSWAKSYPFLFDELDIKIALNQAQYGYHYFEWLAAILIFHSEGLYSLIEKYQFHSHKRKRKILKQLAPTTVIEFMSNHSEFGRTQCPDLLIYNRNYKDWFFAEVKGPNDNITPEQIEFFNQLEKVTGKTVMTLEFSYL